MAKVSQRKMPIKTEVIALTGDWDGWSFTARTNAPISVFSDIASGEFQRIIHGLAKVIRAWNFVDEEGGECPAPSAASIGELPLELVTAIANAFVDELTKLPPV